MACLGGLAVLQVELGEVGGGGEECGVALERLLEAFARFHLVLFAEIGRTPVIENEGAGTELLLQHVDTGQRSVELLVFELVDDQNGIWAAARAFHAGGCLEFGQRAGVALCESGNAEFRSDGRAVGVVPRRLFEMDGGLCEIASGEGDFPGDDEHARIGRGGKCGGQCARCIVDAAQSQLGSRQKADGVEVVGRSRDDLVEMGFGSLQIVQVVLDGPSQQQCGHEFRRAFEDTGEMVACALDLVFPEVDQGLKIPALQAVGRVSQCGVDFLPRFGQLVLADRDFGQRQMAWRMFGVQLERGPVDFRSSVEIAGGAQQVAFEEQAVEMIGGDLQRLIDDLARRLRLPVGDGQPRLGELYLGVVRCGSGSRFQDLACLGLVV